MSFIDELKRLHEAAKDDGMHETEMERALLNEFLQNKAEAIIALVEAMQEINRDAWSDDKSRLRKIARKSDEALAALAALNAEAGDE